MSQSLMIFSAISKVHSQISNNVLFKSKQECLRSIYLTWNIQPVKTVSIIKSCSQWVKLFLVVIEITIYFSLTEVVRFKKIMKQNSVKKYKVEPSCACEMCVFYVCEGSEQDLVRSLGSIKPSLTRPIAALNVLILSIIDLQIPLCSDIF